MKVNDFPTNIFVGNYRYTIEFFEDEMGDSLRQVYKIRTAHNPQMKHDIKACQSTAENMVEYLNKSLGLWETQWRLEGHNYEYIPSTWIGAVRYTPNI